MREFFEGIPAVTHQGSYASYPFAFRFYDPERIVAGRPMREHFRFALPVGELGRFGLTGSDILLASMELLHKLGISYYTMTDRVLAKEGASLRESHARLDEVTAAMGSLQETFQVRALRVAADFSHPRYCYGAATSSCADIYAFAAAQVKKSMETAHLLGAQYFCFSGGQEIRGGFYASVDDALESANLLRFLARVGEYAGALGFPGRLCVRPFIASKMNFTKIDDEISDENESFVEEHYWPSAAHALDFLRSAGLHAFGVDMPLAGPLSDLRMLLQAQRLGLFEARPMYGGGLVPLMARVQLELLRLGVASGGMVLDLRSAVPCSTPEDYVIHCIMYMDACACGLLLAQRILLDGRVEQFRRERYSGFGYGIGQAAAENRADLTALEQHALAKGDVQAATNRIEYMENVFQGMLCRGV